MVSRINVSNNFLPLRRYSAITPDIVTSLLWRKDSNLNTTAPRTTPNDNIIEKVFSPTLDAGEQLELLKFVNPRLNSKYKDCNDFEKINAFRDPENHLNPETLFCLPFEEDAQIYIDYCKVFFKAGGDINIISNSSGEGILHKIVRLSSAKVLPMRKVMDMDTNDINEYERMQNKINEYCITIINFLSKKGANFNIYSADRETPLHIAVLTYANTLIVKTLFEAGAINNILNDYAQTPSNYLDDFSSKEIKQLFEQYK